jgi:hypothetical protein
VRVCQFRHTGKLLAGVVGIEPTPKVLETFVLPLNYTPIMINFGYFTSKKTLDIFTTVKKLLIFCFAKIIGGGGRIRTAEPGGSGFTVRRV